MMLKCRADHPPVIVLQQAIAELAETSALQSAGRCTSASSVTAPSKRPAKKLLLQCPALRQAQGPAG